MNNNIVRRAASGEVGWMDGKLLEEFRCKDSKQKWRYGELMV